MALADVKEDLLLQEADEPNLDRRAELPNIAQLKAVLNDCAIQAEKNMTSNGRCDPESQGQNNIVESLTNVYLPNTKKSLAIKGKIAKLIDNMLTGGLSTDTVKQKADKYFSLENTGFFTSQVLMKTCGTCS